ncbi:MAG TPA: methyltransferase [Nannocystis sp.]
MAPPSATLMEIVAGKWRPYALWVVAELGIADLLKDGPRDVAELARATGTNEEALLRILRPLAHDGILARRGEREFALTALSQPLRSDHPSSVRQTIRNAMGPYNQRSWAELLEVVRTGEPAFARLHGGRNIWTWFAEEAPELGQIFHDAMAQMTRMAVPLLVASYDFGQHPRILDLGGGQGVLIAGILKAFPHVRGGILDFKEALAAAPATLEREGVADRVELIEGDIFAAIPTGWDAYMMKHIIHGMTAPSLAKLLTGVREAMTASSRLLVIEMLVPEDDSGVYPASLDLQMLIASGGRERSASEYRQLFAAHGLRLVDVVRNASPNTLLVVARA